jgi:hypothetical protein
MKAHVHCAGKLPTGVVIFDAEDGSLTGGRKTLEASSARWGPLGNSARGLPR